MPWATEMKSFLLVFEPVAGPRRDILDYFDTRPEILNWYAIFSGAILLVSEHNAFELSELFRTRFPGREFFLTELPAYGNNGWMLPTVWEFVNNPKSSGRWK